MFSCKQGKKSEVVSIASTDSSAVAVSFFPVTTYLKGQVMDIRKRGVNPLKYVTIHSKTDSSWVKMEDLDIEVAPFLHPVIDTTNLLAYFTEKKFLDQTINAYTFTYDPTRSLPDTFPIKHWDVYVDPSLNKVTRIYMIKSAPGNKTIQLTWQSDKWFKIITIGRGNNEQDTVEKELYIKWNF